MSTDAGVARTIDAHHHLWDLTVRDQPWTADLPVLRRTFTMNELCPLLAAAGVHGTVLVETINVPEETPELLAVAASQPVVRGVVGWVDLTATDVADEIARLRELPGGDRLVGVRHQVQGEPDPQWLTRPEVLLGLREVATASLVFDLLVLPAQLPAAIEAVDRVPEGRFVLSHLGKPPIATGLVQPWGAAVKQLAERDNVACKLSGMVTEASPSWSVADLEPYAAHVLSAFGPERVMAGSDWPVCLLRAGYGSVWHANEELVSALSADERSAVLGGVATTWYGLS
jgi:L-fuconolactonase